MKKYFLFNHWFYKSIKRKNEKTKKISIAGVSPKYGVTHLSLCIANFLSSALKKSVLYIELSNESQLLGLVGLHTTTVCDITCYKLKDVTYALACDVSTATCLLNEWPGYVVVDIHRLTWENSPVYNQCEKKILIGSTVPWCIAELFDFINTLKGAIDMKNILFLRKNKSIYEINEKSIYIKLNQLPLPEIDNPFSLKESDFESLFQLIE